MSKLKVSAFALSIVGGGVSTVRQYLQLGLLLSKP